MVDIPENPDLPDYGGGCLCNVVPELLEPGDQAPEWLPPQLHQPSQVVLLVLDGLGWDQLQARRNIAPTITGLQGSYVHTVAPSTTSAALTSIATGLPPGEHGVVGYRVAVGSEVLNILRWNTRSGDARRTIPPQDFQIHEPFLGHRPPIVTRADFSGSGFTLAHLRTARQRGYRVPSTMIVELRRLLQDGEPFVYAYYEGIDKVAHEYGLGEFYDAELAAVDRLVADMLEILPQGAILAVTADHGQVDVGDNVVSLSDDVLAHVSSQSGEGRFRWLHARPGRLTHLVEAAACYSDVAWVATRDEVIEDGWFGPVVTDAARSRLGDVALVARADISFFDAQDSGPFTLIGRHGSLTPAEMRVPLLASAL